MADCSEATSSDMAGDYRIVTKRPRHVHSSGIGNASHGC
ncbi:MAG: hypothetical protein ACI92S_003740, partial [Planctomycetaceae bacterium]